VGFAGVEGKLLVGVVPPTGFGNEMLGFTPVCGVTPLDNLLSNVFAPTPATAPSTVFNADLLVLVFGVKTEVTGGLVTVVGLVTLGAGRGTGFGVGVVGFINAGLTGVTGFAGVTTFGVTTGFVITGGLKTLVTGFGVINGFVITGGLVILVTGFFAMIVGFTTGFAIGFATVFGKVRVGRATGLVTGTGFDTLVIGRGAVLMIGLVAMIILFSLSWQ
jgi:hypothetical protein